MFLFLKPGNKQTVKEFLNLKTKEMLWCKIKKCLRDCTIYRSQVLVVPGFWRQLKFHISSGLVFNIS